MSQNQDYVEAGKVDEISNGQMKHVEINGKEIVIANLNGKFYAFAERCVSYECKTLGWKYHSKHSNLSFSCRLLIITGDNYGTPNFVVNRSKSFVENSGPSWN